ncbi:MAG: hypothetical protein WC848_02830 [Parcubacteria group bacterium]|jgi:hypothetical protein
MEEPEKTFSPFGAWVMRVKEKIEKNAGVLLVLVFLLFWLGVFLAQPVNLVSIDLGRHIENGRYFFATYKIPDTNLYSYTYPDIPFINHHWGSGVLFFLIWKVAGIAGLSFLYIVLSLITFSILFFMTKKFAGLPLAVLASTLVIPLIGERTEVRPEVFSYFFAVIFFLLLWRYKKGELKTDWLFLLPIFALFWVNLHIYFIFGIGLIGLFLLDTVREKNWKQFKILFLVLVLTIGASLVSPFGIRGLIYPLNIFRNYGYRVLENQSVSFLTNLGFINNPNLIIVKIVLLVLFLSTVVLFITNRKKINWPLLGLSVTVGILGWSALRNFSLFGYFALPALAYNLKYGFGRKIDLKDGTVQTLIFALAGLFFFTFSFLSQGKLMQANGNTAQADQKAQEASAVFFRENNLKGPIFNNYDIGSYLIFHLYPQEKVFVDNRPEVYPDTFFQDIYIPMQDDDAAWQRANEQYDFNVIYFATHDATNWGQDFLVKRIKDPQWAPVFADEYAIIFLKRNEQNEALISRFEMSQDHFRITSAP